VGGTCVAPARMDQQQVGVDCSTARRAQRRGSAPSPPAARRGACRRPAQGGSATRPLRPGCKGRDGRTAQVVAEIRSLRRSAAGPAVAPGFASRPSAPYAAWTGALRAEGHVGISSVWRVRTAAHLIFFLGRQSRSFVYLYSRAFSKIPSVLKLRVMRTHPSFLL